MEVQIIISYNMNTKHKYLLFLKNFLNILLFLFFISFSLFSHALTITIPSNSFPSTDDELFDQENFIAQLIGQEYDVYYAHAGLRDVEQRKSCLNATVLFSVNKTKIVGAVNLKGMKNTYKRTKRLTFTDQLKNGELEFEGRDGSNLFRVETAGGNFMFVTYGKNLECRVMLEVQKLGDDTLTYMLEHRAKGLLPLPLNEFASLIDLEEVDTSTTTNLTVKRDKEGPDIIADDMYLSNEDYVVEILGRVRDENPIGVLKIDGDRVIVEKSGEFSHSLFVMFEEQEVDIVAIDKFGNRSAKIVKLERPQTISTKNYEALNPSKNSTNKINTKSAALIIGVEEYEYTHDAPYANNDAIIFKDFAVKTLGIPADNIKALVNTEGSRLNTKRTLKKWLPQIMGEGVTDFYLFFSGHGLATADGEDLYLLPYDGDPTLLEDSALTREEIFSTINAFEPNNVIVFLDTCYSGTTRSDENLLVAAKPVSIDVVDKGVPNNFTVFTASANNEIASSLEGAKHGLFSYFMMKGLEGSADLNEDQKITTGELHAYVQKKVTRESMQLGRVQTPQLSGNTNKVLIEW